MKAEKCYDCEVWAEPPFKITIEMNAPATREDFSRLMRGEECAFVKISRPLCRYCSYARSHDADFLTDEDKDALDLSEEG